MLLMFCAGLGWVYFEGRQGTSKMSKDTRISTVNTALTAMKINALTGDARTKQNESLISPLEFQPTQCQVPADDLVFNPFEIYLYRIEVKEQAEKPKEEPKVVEVKAPSLKGKTLESVLLGGRPAAMINSRTYYVGQKLNGWKIQEIKPNRVILRWKNKTHVLKMD
jgi:hypothetical protein